MLFLAKVLEEAALLAGERVFAYEIHGMSQRGGSVYASLKIGDYDSPQLFFNDVDILLALENSNVFPYLPYLKKGGVLAANCSGMAEEERKWLSGQAYDCLFVDADAKALAVANPRSANLVLLGELLRSGKFPLAVSAIEDALRSTVRPEHIESNLRALH